MIIHIKQNLEQIILYCSNIYVPYFMVVIIQICYF
jgi:hypothetical protein